VASIYQKKKGQKRIKERERGGCGPEVKHNIAIDNNNKYRQRIRNRNEAPLIKVDNGKQWLQSYKELMRAKKALNVTTGVRKTKDGNILIELKAETSPIEAADKIKLLTNITVIPKLLQNIVSIEIKNVDPLSDAEELKNDLIRDQQC
jgi:hypothetical protein